MQLFSFVIAFVDECIWKNIYTNFNLLIDFRIWKDKICVEICSNFKWKYFGHEFVINFVWRKLWSVENMTGHPSIQNCCENILSNALLNDEIDFKNLISNSIDCQNCNGSCADEMNLFRTPAIINICSFIHWFRLLSYWNGINWPFHSMFIS